VAFDKYLQFQGYYHADIETSASFSRYLIFPSWRPMHTEVIRSCMWLKMPIRLQI